MKMRDRLFIFSTVQLVLFGALFALVYWQFATSIVPAFQRNLLEKTASAGAGLAGQIDVALATDDPALAATVIAPFVNDPDFQHVVIRDAQGGLLLERGTRATPAFEGAPLLAQRAGEGVATWSPVTLEGVELGAIAITYSSTRIDAIQAWVRWIAVIVAVVWVLALGYSAWFARSFVLPLRAMMRFSRRVAEGALTERLVIDARDELRGLQQDLNAMASDLELREADRQDREADRQRQAAETAQMQEALLVMSRTAGMAEVATNVLHNVGNVLNSLNVSVSMILHQLDGSRVGSLTRLSETLDQAPGGIAGFLDTAKGKLVPAYLRSLASHLAAEHVELRAELTSVTTNVEHIKTIIATQQAFAQHSGMIEVVSLAPLIDDALRMGEVSFARHGIEVIKDYDDAALTIETDRHRLLEILINVVTNARHALREPGLSVLQLWVQLRRSPQGISIAFADTGSGIAAEHLAKVFQHGFTTKRDGHGFGLHACANAAQALGGTISAASDGAGRGATFTIHLPLQCPHREPPPGPQQGPHDQPS